MAPLFQQALPHERAAVQRNLARILPYADQPRLARGVRALFRNFAYAFADLVSLNRQPLSVLQRYVHGVQGQEYLHAALASRRGFIAATAHIGNWDLGSRLLSGYGRTVHVLVAPEQHASIQRLLREHNRPTRLRFVPNDGTGAFVQLLIALRRGDIVAFQADRAIGHRSDMPVTFFGAPARFPSGPLMLAAAAQVPVLPCFCLLRPDARYDIFVDEAITVCRGQEATALQQMVRVLERYVSMAPEQWFNFYDVWDKR